MCLCVCICVRYIYIVCVGGDIYIVTWCPTEKIEIRLLLSPVRELTVASRQSKECESKWRPTDVGTL